MDRTSRGIAPILIVVIFGAISVVGFLVLKPLLTSPLPTLSPQPTPTSAVTDKSGQTGQTEKDGCIVSGCNSTICDDEPQGSICDVRPEYGCYRFSTCERQEDGECGWAQTEELKKCLAQYTQEPDKSPDAQRKADIYLLRNALEQYKLDGSNLYPSSLQTLITENYLKELPQDPFTGEPYTYQVSANRLDYTITATLEDGSSYKASPP